MATNSVDTAKLMADSVSTVKILDGAVTTPKQAADSVTTAKILNANITTPKMASDSVVTAAILNFAVTMAKMAFTVVPGTLDTNKVFCVLSATNLGVCNPASCTCATPQGN